MPHSDDLPGSPYAEPRFDAFLSYSTDPDYRLVRETERFLESFHRVVRIGPTGETLRPLNICRDDSDFSLARARRQASEEAPGEAIRHIIGRHLVMSRRLVVFCSRRSARSHYVDFEIREFLARNVGEILLVVTEGEVPETELDVFPPAAVEAGLHHEPFFDFREARQKARGGRLRDHEDARVALAARLHGLAAGDLFPLWEREERRRSQRRMRMATAVGVALASLLVVALSLYVKAERQNAVLRSELAYRESLDMHGKHPVGAIRRALDAVHIHPSVHAQGRLLDAMATLDGVLHIRDVNPVGVRRAAVSPDGRFVYTVDAEYGFAVHRAGALSPVARLRLPAAADPDFRLTSGANTLGFMGGTAIAAGQERVFVGGQHGELFVLSVAEPGRPRVTADIRRPGAILDLAIAGDRLFAGRDDGVVDVFDISPPDSVAALRSWTAHDGPVYGLHASVDHLATAGGDGRGIIWGHAGRRVRSISTPHGPYYAVEFAPGGLEVAFGDSHGKVEIVDLATGDRRVAVDDLPDRVRRLAYDPSGQLLVACAGRAIEVVDLGRSRRLVALPAHGEPSSEVFVFAQVADVAFAPTGHHLFSVGNDGRLYVRDFMAYAFGPDMFDVTIPAPQPVLFERRAIFSAETRLVGRMGNDTLVFRQSDDILVGAPADRGDLRRIHSRVSPSSVTEPDVILVPAPMAISAISVSKHLVAIGGSDGTIEVVSGTDGRVVGARTQVHAEAVCCLGSGPTSGRWLSGTTGGALASVDIDPTGLVRVTELRAAGGRVSHVAITPDGRTGFVFLDDSAVVAHDFATGTRTTHTLQLRYPVAHVEFLSDEQAIVATTGGTVAEWRPALGTVYPFETRGSGHSTGVHRVASSSAGTMIVTTNGDEVCIWSTAAQALITCDAMSAPLSGVWVDPGTDQASMIVAGRFLLALPLGIERWRQRALEIIGDPPPP